MQVGRQFVLCEPLGGPELIDERLGPGIRQQGVACIGWSHSFEHVGGVLEGVEYGPFVGSATSNGAPPIAAACAVGS